MRHTDKASRPRFFFERKKGDLVVLINFVHSEMNVNDRKTHNLGRIFIQKNKFKSLLFKDTVRLNRFLFANRQL